MISCREILRKTEEKKIAIGHFNISTIDALWGIFDAAKERNAPVIIGVSEGERDFIGIPEVVALVKSIREEHDYPIFLNADHTYSFERAKEAINAGFDSVIFDGAKLSIEENIKVTKQCVEYAHKIVQETGRDVMVEGELGYIGEGSNLRDELPTGVETTSVVDAQRFVQETGVDLFAPAVGNVHGMLRPPIGETSGDFDPPLDIVRISEIAKAIPVPLVLHGGSGTPNLGDGIKAGISEVHISTEIRKAWRDAMFKHMSEYRDDLAPYKIGKEAREAIEQVVTERLKLFSKT